ncbi:hypothetical protein [Fretibacter rubidus]|uniref:hypothetical protein n=1 Tax=Fretibacter rubidus TaxID=570162 RepID=UPI003529D6DD
MWVLNHLIIRAHNTVSLRQAFKAALAGAALTAVMAQSAAASFLDTDFWCRTYGCVVVHDGDNYDIYDNWVFGLNNCCVSMGQPLISYYDRAGTPNVTGTLDNVIGARASSTESMMLGFTDGNNSLSAFNDDGDGYLDAGDNMSAFTLSSATDLELDGPGRQYSHSFFISSRNMRFSMRARASIANVTGDFANTIGLGDIKLTPSVTDRGNDEGFDFGRRANANNITIVNAVDDLGDLSGTATQIMNFGRQSGIRVRNGDIDEQTIRLDMLYTMPQYDLSMGIGSLDIDVVFDFYREP